MRRFVLMFFCVLIVAGGFQTPSFAVTDPPAVLAESAVLIDAKTGQVLYEKDADALKEPASTTKMITGLLALENLSLDKVLTIDEEASFTDGSRIFLIEGEEITVEHLLYALLLESANDTAVALAKEISGTVEDFASLMNQKAKEMGAKNPNFKNPHGLHQEGHLMSAYDLAMIAKTAMENPEFRKIVSTIEHKIPATNKQPERDYIYTTNRLIYDEGHKVPVGGVMTPAKYGGATGVKTGYTPDAGGCLVASAERDGTELIAVVLKSTDDGRFGDCIALLDYGFENYYTHMAVDSGLEIEDTTVQKGEFNHVEVRVREALYVTLPKEASSSIISTRVVMPDKITAPVSAGQDVGSVEVYEGSNQVGTVTVIAEADVPEGMFLSRFGIEDSVSKKIKAWAIGIACAVIVLLAAYLILKIRYERRRKARRLRRAMEIAREREKRQRELTQRRWPY